MLSSVTRGCARSVPIAVGFGDEPSTCRFIASMSVLLPEDPRQYRRSGALRSPCRRLNAAGSSAIVRVLVRSLCAGQVKHFAGSERVALAMGVVVIARVANAIEPAIEDARRRVIRRRYSNAPDRPA